MKLNEMKQLLDSGQIQLTKALGQNFLHDGNQLRRIVEYAGLKKTDRVLEIGPGLGPLTELLVAQAGEVLAIEKDRRLFEIVRQRFAAAKNFTVLHDDALEYIRREKRDWRDWKLVANLPYSVASPILVELAQSETCPERLVATLQLEVVRRVMASADDDDYGVLSLLLQLRYEPRAYFKIPPECFFPAPDVDSGCIVLARRETPLLPFKLHAGFDRLVKLGFSQRRKMMFKLLKQQYAVEKLTDAFARLELSPQIRAEKVSLEQFVKLAEILLPGKE